MKGKSFAIMAGPVGIGPLNCCYLESDTHAYVVEGPYCAENQLRGHDGPGSVRVMLVRRQTSGDVEAIRTVTALAFARSGEDVPGEALLVGWLRASLAWIPELSLVAAEPGGAVVGHVVCTRGTVGHAAALALGPLSVRPDWQRKGVGKALMHAVLGAADALGEPLVALLGSTAYYPRFGFRPASEYGITPRHPEWTEHFQVRALTAYDPAVRGEFAYPEPFDRL